MGFTLEIEDTGLETTTSISAPYPQDETTASAEQLLAGTFQVQSGSPITIDVENMTFTESVSLEDTAVPTQNLTTTGKGSGDNSKITIQGKLDRTKTTDTDKIKLLRFLTTSNGFKTIRYNGVTSTSNWDGLFESLYTLEEAFITCRIKTFTLRIIGTNILTYSLIIEVTL